MKKAFLDTSYAIALTASTDRWHQRAIRLAKRLQTDQTKIITTQAILLEIGNSLSKQRHRRAAISLLESLENDPMVEIVPISKVLYQSAFRLFCDRSDKDWGLVDCLSCVVIQKYGVSEALTRDIHFRQMGFRPLLRDEGV